MIDRPVETRFRRDRIVGCAALILLTVLAWIYLLSLPRTMTMSGMMMPDIPTLVMPMAWSARDILLMFVMWTIMMIGMMTPSAAPMVLLYARVARQAEGQGKHFAASAWFAGGYLLSWTAFSLAATTAQYVLDRASLLTLGMFLASHRTGGAVLIAAGIYQWTTLKDSCLRQCRAPLAFIQQHGGFKGTVAGSLGLGFHHGLYCIGCCWVLMALLFVVGVMNIAWIAAIAALVLLEKAFPAGRVVARIAGTVLAVSGTLLLIEG